MADTTQAPQSALKYEVQVREHGRVELQLPFAPGARVIIFVVPEVQESLTDLVAASESSLAFWENPLDDEDWNNA